MLQLAASSRPGNDNLLPPKIMTTTKVNIFVSFSTTLPYKYNVFNLKDDRILSGDEIYEEAPMVEQHAPKSIATDSTPSALPPASFPFRFSVNVVDEDKSSFLNSAASRHSSVKKQLIANSPLIPANLLPVAANDSEYSLLHTNISAGGGSVSGGLNNNASSYSLDIDQQALEANMANFKISKSNLDNNDLSNLPADDSMRDGSSEQGLVNISQQLAADGIILEDDVPPLEREFSNSSFSRKHQQQGISHKREKTGSNTKQRRASFTDILST